jgi:hypothetical protein
MGVAIINSTLRRIFKDSSTAALTLRSTLDRFIIFKTDNAKTEDDQAFWKGADGFSIILNDFLDYVLQPHVANLLIMDDLKIMDTEAEETRCMSKKYGLKFNFETDDGRVDEITMANASANLTEKNVPGKIRRKEIVSSSFYFHQDYITLPFGLDCGECVTRPRSVDNGIQKQQG